MISIFTPTHNAAFLKEVYASIAQQDFDSWEWVVLLNNGATYQNDDPRVKVVRDSTNITNVGYLKRIACSHCSGDILMELDHDDLLLAGALRECQEAFTDPSVSFAYSNTVNHDVRTNQPIHWSSQYGWTQRPYHNGDLSGIESVSAAPFPQSISRIWFAPNHFRAWRADFYWAIGGHNGNMNISDDHDLMCRTYIAGKMVHIDKPLYYYRVHGDNTWLKNCDSIQTTMWGNHDRYIDPMARRWARDNGLRCLDLCGGIDKPEGYESVDKVNGDVLADLEHTWPFEDNSVGVIRAFDAVEHMVNPINTMNEAWRVLAHGGFFLIEVPSTDGMGAWCDPTHRSFWNRRSFRYYTEAAIQRYIKGAGANCRFQSLKVENVKRHDDLPYVAAHLVAVKQDSPRFYGELQI